MSRLLSFAFAFGLSVFTVAATAAPRLSEINLRTVTLLAGEPAWFEESLRITDALAHEQGLKLLPMQGAGCITSAADVLQITQVDVGLLTSDCVAYAERQGLLPNASKRLAYVVRVKSLPLVIVTRKDIPTITALAGKRVATGPAHSAAFASGELLLGGIDLSFIRVPRTGVEGLTLLQQGKADAVLLQGLSALDGSLDPLKFHVLGLTAPTSSGDTFAPALVQAADLKGLAGPQAAIETVSTALVLAVFNWPQSSPKARKIRHFSSAYFTHFAESETAHELSAKVSGWTRYSAAQRALEDVATAANTSQDEPN